MLFYGTTASGAGWIVPKKYVEKVGEDGFKKAPIGAGPYRVVSSTPGVELVLEAFDGYWRKAPSIKRLVMRTMTEETTRAAALKRGEVDLAYLFAGPVAEELRRTPGVKLEAPLLTGAFWLELPEQWDPKSPWHDRRVRLATSHAIDRKAINQAETLGFSRLTGSIVPRIFQFAITVEPPAYDLARAKKLLAEAGYPNGFDAGEFYPFPPYNSMGEAIIGYLQTVGIKSRMRVMGRRPSRRGVRGQRHSRLPLLGAVRGPQAQAMSEILTDAIRYWEWRRIAYNAVLASIVIVLFSMNWPASLNRITVSRFELLFVLAVLANVAYCAAYVVDVTAQSSAFRSTWIRYRWMLFALGVLFAGTLTQFFAAKFFHDAA